MRQLTTGKGCADFDCCYLPDGRILFNSTRCGQIVDCWYNDVSTLFRMMPDGTNQRAYYGANGWFPTALFHARWNRFTEKARRLRDTYK